MSVSRQSLPAVTIINAGSMTGTNVLTSTTLKTDMLESIGIEAVWTGTPNGTFAINYSMDGVTFYPLTTSTITNPAGSASNTNGVLTGFPFPYMNITYTNASSTGTLTVKASGKGV